MEQQLKKRKSSLLTYEEALAEMAGVLDTTYTQAIKVGGFYEFVRDVWSHSYERPELFGAWHVGVICDDYQRALEEHKNYCYLVSRFHLKSTLAYAFTVWMFLQNSGTKFDSSGLYMSYSDTMSLYHTSEMKKAIRRNEQLTEWMKDKSPQADFSFRYTISGTSADLLHGGLFTFKRGTHVNRLLVADDILRDPDNPLNLSQLDKAEEHFMTETIHIPVNNAITVVLGTPMAPNDLLTKLKSDDRFIYRALPALDPAPGRRVLCPEIRTEAQLVKEQELRPRSFASEMLLQPYLSTNGYLSYEEIKDCDNAELVCLDPHKLHDDIDSDFTVAGADIGKKNHPSHVSIFRSKNGRMIQVLQVFLDKWAYTDQVAFFNELVKNFHIDRAYIDNTRGELEERGLNTVWRPMSFTQKSKHMMAQVFEMYVHNKQLEFIPDERQRSQIISVDANLDAPVTPMGHGDSFFSNALACLAYHESERRGTFEVGNVGDLLTPDSPTSPKNLAFPKMPTEEYNTSTQSCPNCGASGVAWVAARSLCLICKYRA